MKTKLFLIAALLCAVPACAGLASIPLKTCLVTEQGTICYSSKGGLTAEVDLRSGK